MLLNIFVSTILFLIFLAFGNVMMFLDSFAYFLLLPYVIFIILINQVYHENCKTMEMKDFIFTLLIVLLDLVIYYVLDYPISIDIFSYLYLATFVPFLSFATTIRFKSLM